jgi:hypothetical protein
VPGQQQPRSSACGAIHSPAAAASPADPLQLSALAWIRQLVACGLLFLLSARIPAHLAAVVTAITHPARGPFHGPVSALAMVGVDGFGVLCAVYLSHGRLRGVPLLRCYPPQRLIPLSLHFLGLLWGLLSLGLENGGSGG